MEAVFQLLQLLPKARLSKPGFFVRRHRFFTCNQSHQPQFTHEHPIFFVPWLAPTAAILFIACTALIPRWWCGLDGSRWFEGESQLVISLAREVAATAHRSVSEKDFTSDNSVLKDEWQFGTYQMTALGLLQIVQANPSHRVEFMLVIEKSRRRAHLRHRAMARGRTRHARWPKSHAAYLDYLNVVLGVPRQLVPNSRFTALNARISRALARRPEGQPARYDRNLPRRRATPWTTSAAAAYLLLHTHNTGENHEAALLSALHFKKPRSDPGTGLPYQSIVIARTGCPMDRARAKGTDLSARC